MTKFILSLNTAVIPMYALPGELLLCIVDENDDGQQ